MKKYNKLVRDRIPEIIKKNGDTPSTHTATGKEFSEKLYEKLVEEAIELKNSHDPTEAADLLEVLYEILQLEGWQKEEIENLRFLKAKERGGFNNKTVLDSVS